jgi:hypothetical protein
MAVVVEAIVALHHSAHGQRRRQDALRVRRCGSEGRRCERDEMRGKGRGMEGRTSTVEGEVGERKCWSWARANVKAAEFEGPRPGGSERMCWPCWPWDLQRDGDGTPPPPCEGEGEGDHVVIRALPLA